MNLVYLDPGLSRNVGHHANHCRALRAEALGRGLGFVTLGLVGVEPDLREELDVVPFFRVDPYQWRGPDPMAGWLDGFMFTLEHTAQDLTRLRVGRDDMVLLGCGWGAHVLAITRWLAAQPMEQQPAVVMDLMWNPGMHSQRSEHGYRFVAADPRVRPDPYFYRLAGLRMKEMSLRCFRPASRHPVYSGVYRNLMDCPVGVLPSLMTAVTQARSRVGKRPLTVSFLGHQGQPKGYHFVPAIADALLRGDWPVHVLVHDSAPDWANPRESQMLQAMARGDFRLSHVQAGADADAWARLLERSDLVVCPYDPVHYEFADSGIVAEAAANGIPMVVPRGSSMARWLNDGIGAGTSFEAFSVESILQAIDQVLQDYDAHAARAHALAQDWPSHHGPARYLDQVLALARS